MGSPVLITRQAGKRRAARLPIRAARVTQICRQKADNINSFVLKFKAEGEYSRTAALRGG
jgi:hypothetical protein